MTDTPQIPSAIETLENQGPTVPVDQVGHYVAALSTLQGLNYRRQEDVKRNAAPTSPAR